MVKLVLACLTTTGMLAGGTIVENAVKYAKTSCTSDSMFYDTSKCFKEDSGALYFKFECGSGNVIKKQSYTASGCAQKSTGAGSSDDYPVGECKYSSFKMEQGCLRMECSSAGSKEGTYNTCTPAPAPTSSTTTTTTSAEKDDGSIEVFMMEEFGKEKCGGNATSSKYYATGQCIKDSAALYSKWECAGGKVSKQYYKGDTCAEKSTGANNLLEYKMDTCKDDFFRPKGKCKRMICTEDKAKPHVFDKDKCKDRTNKTADAPAVVGLGLTALALVAASVA